MIAYFTVRVSDTYTEEVLHLAVEGKDLTDAMENLAYWVGGAMTFSSLRFTVEGATMNRPRAFHTPLIPGVPNGVIRAELSKEAPSKIE